MDLPPWLALSFTVLLHAAWNLLTRWRQQRARSRDPAQELLWWVLLTGTLIGSPALLWWLAQGLSADLAWATLINAVAMPSYFGCLAAAYARGPAGVVYPVARSSALLVALFAGVFLGEALGALGWIGVAVSSAGVLALAIGCGGGRPAVPWAIGASASTAVYSVADRIAAQELGSWLERLAYVTPGFLTGWLALMLVRRAHRSVWWPPRPPIALTAVATFAMLGAYLCTITALASVPAAVGLAFANGGVLLVTVLGIVWLRERERAWSRLAAVVIASIGLLLLGLR